MLWVIYYLKILKYKINLKSLIKISKIENNEDILIIYKHIILIFHFLLS
jgi:hypothetical protein